MSLPPDVLFAQKASAVVKAAGMDPKLLDLEKFRHMASVIFVRAYQAIYREYFNFSSSNNHNDADSDSGIIQMNDISLVATVTSEDISAFLSSKLGEKQAQNAQLVLEGLRRRTENPALNNLNGHDICKGSHRAIGVCVGILFAEGQRLWLEKLKQQQQQEGGVAEDGRDQTNGKEINNSPSRSNSKKHRKLKNAAGQFDPRPPGKRPQSAGAGKASSPYIRHLQNQDPRKEATEIANRIAHLKEQLNGLDAGHIRESRDDNFLTSTRILNADNLIENVSDLESHQKRKKKKSKKIRSSSPSHPAETDTNTGNE